MAETENNGSERATLNAVAFRAGVSPTTASLVLAGKGNKRRISELTHRRVQTAAEELNYVPNLGIRALRGERTNILSLFSTYRNRSRDDLYMNTLSSAIEAAGGKEGYDILVHCNFGRSPKEIYQFLSGGLADGLLLFAPRPQDPLLALLRKGRLPVVVINGTQIPDEQFSSVSDDARQGMQSVAEEIIANGHRRIGMLIDPDPETPDSQKRADYLKLFLGERGVTVLAEHIYPARERDVDEILDRIQADANPPTAIFSWHDRLAYTFISRCEARGIIVPDLIAVAGYDGLHWPARTSQVVSGARVDFDDLAETAVRLLNQAILTPEAKPTNLLLPVSLLSGTSMGPHIRNGAI
ncbi:LacI family DNA-binding transcriptional regulator [soil metagenome]